MSRRYAYFDAGNKGASLAVENGGILLTTTASGLNRNRSCRSTVAQNEDNSDVEFIPFGTGDIAGRLSLGLCTAAASMSDYIGGNAESIGYLPAEGQVHVNGVSVQSVATAGLSDAIRIGVTFGTTPVFAVWVNGALIGTEDLPVGIVGEEIYFGVSLGSDAAPGDIQVQANAGARAMEFPGAGFSGWWAPYALPEAVRISTIDYLSHHDDDLPNTRWHGGITGRSGGERRGFSVWPWGDEHQVQASIMQLEVTDPDGLLDNLLSPAYRYQPVTVRFVDHDAPLSETVETQTWYFDRCEVVDDLRKNVYLRDIFSLLELPLQPRAFRPDVDPQAANQWMPTLIGVAGSIPVTLVDADVSSAPEPMYQIAGQDVEQIGKVREAGVPLDSATDFTLLAGGQQLQLAASPDAGEITLDAARTGPGYVPPAPVDALGGDGNPFVDGGGGDIVGWGRYQDDAGIPDTRPFYSAPGRVTFPQNSNTPQAHLVKESSPGVPDPVLIAGQRYRYSMTVYQLSEMETGGFQAQIGLSYGPTQFTPYDGQSSMNSTNFWAGNPAGDPRTITGTFVSLSTHAPNVYYYGTNNISGTNAIVGALTFIELPPLNDTGDDEAVEDALPKTLLEDGARMIIETHGGYLPNVWDADSAAAIDTETGYEGGGIHENEQTTLRQALERFLPGYTAGMYKTRAGLAAFARLKLPEEEIGSDPVLIDGTELLADLIVVRDGGLGLTRQMGARKNHRVLTAADVDKPALNLTQRARLARDFRYVLATGAALAPGYEHVDAADTLETHLWMPADAQAEIDFVGRAYTIGRAFYELFLPFRDDIDVGTIALLTYDRYGMEAGIPIFCVPVEEDRINDTMRVIGWGPAPYEDF